MGLTGILSLSLVMLENIISQYRNLLLSGELFSFAFLLIKIPNLVHESMP